MESGLVLFSGATVVLAAAVTYLSFYIYRNYAQHVPRGWLDLILTLLFLTLNRLVILLSDLDIFPAQSDFLKVAGLASFFLAGLVGLFGFWQIKESFEEYERVDREAMEKIRHFDSKRSRAAAKKRRK